VYTYCADIHKALIAIKIINWIRNCYKLLYWIILNVITSFSIQDADYDCYLIRSHIAFMQVVSLHGCVNIYCIDTRLLHGFKINSEITNLFCWFLSFVDYRRFILRPICNVRDLIEKFSRFYFYFILFTFLLSNIEYRISYVRNLMQCEFSIMSDSHCIRLSISNVQYFIFNSNIYFLKILIRDILISKKDFIMSYYNTGFILHPISYI